jgi:hypothetical protein
VPNRNLARESDHDVEPERRDRQIADLDQNAEPILAEHQRRKAEQGNHGNRRIAARCGRENNGIRRIGGAEIAGGKKALHCHDWNSLNAFDVFGAK